MLSMFSMYYSVNSNKANTEFWEENEIVEHRNEEQMLLLLTQLVNNTTNQTEIIETMIGEIEMLKNDKLTDFEIALISYLDNNERQSKEIIELIEMIRIDIIPEVNEEVIE